MGLQHAGHNWSAGIFITVRCAFSICFGGTTCNT